MKSNIFIGIAAVAILGINSGCQKLDEFIQFDLKYTQEVIIPANTTVNLPIDLNTGETQTDIENELALNDSRKDLIEEIKLDKLELEITQPVDETFSFLESIHVFIRSDGMDETLIALAQRNSISDNIGAILELETVEADLTEYIQQDAFSIRVEAVSDEGIEDAVHINVNSDFEVDTKVAGI